MHDRFHADCAQLSVPTTTGSHLTSGQAGAQERPAGFRHVLDEIIAGHVAVILIINAAQVDHVMRVLEQDGKVERFRAALKKLVVASIGPTASERLRHYDWPVDFETSHPRMGILVKEVSEQASSMLDRKR